MRGLLYDSYFGNAKPVHRLLTPTLHMLSIAPHTSMVFMPTVSHLRAWLTVADKSSFAPAPPSQPAADPRSTSKMGNTSDVGGQQSGRLVVWNLVTSSCHTSEWSVQGLSETLAALIDCGQRLGCSIELAEAVNPVTGTEQHNVGTDDEDQTMHDIPMETDEQDAGSDPGDEIAVALQTAPVQDDIYHRRLPMLNGSSRRAGLDDSAAWSGGTVEVGVVLRRWLQFSSTEV